MLIFGKKAQSGMLTASSVCWMLPTSDLMSPSVLYLEAEGMLCSALDSLNHRGASHSGAAAGALPGSSLGHSHSSGVCEPDLMRLLQWCLLRVMTPDMMVSAVDLLRPRSCHTARALASARHLNSLAVSQVQPSQKVLWPSRTDSGPRGQRKVRPVF